MSDRSTLVAARPAIGAFTAMGAVWGAFAATLPGIKAMLDVDEARLGVLLLFTPLAAVVAMLVAPALGARFGRVALPVAGGLMGLAFLLPGNAPTPWLFVAGMMACGAATGTLDVLMNARTVQIEADHGLPMMNLAHAVYSFGYAGAAIGAGLLRGQGWPPGWILGLVGIVALVLALTTLERDGTITGLRRPDNLAGGGGLGLVPVIGGGMILIAFLTENAAESWSALHIEKTLGGSPEQGALGPAAIALTMGFARLGGQGLAARINAFTLLKGGAVIAAIGTLGVAFAPSPGWAYAGFFVMGIGASVISPTAFSLVGRLSNGKARARAIARATLLGYFGYFFGPPALGFAAGAFGLPAAFVLTAAMLLAIFLLAPLMAHHAGAAEAGRTAQGT